MAVTNPTKLSDFSGFLNRNQAAPIFESARRRSVVQQLVRQVPLGINGESIPVVTGRLTAGWVAEGAQKPASAGTMGLVNMDPKKLAVIAVVSAEVVRANPGGYMAEITNQVGEAFGEAFDLAALYDQGPDGGAGTGPFATFINQTTKAVEIGTGTDIHADLVAGLTLLVNAGKRLTGFALDDRLEPTLLDARDGSDRPLYIDLSTSQNVLPEAGGVRAGRLLNRPSYMGDGVYSGTATDVEAIGGDWSKAAWGTVGGIAYKVSTEAAVTINGTLVSLFENNLVAVRAEAEYGFVCADPESFVRYTNAA